MHVEIDPDLCCASGQCAITAPDVFDQDVSEGVVLLLQPEPPRAAYDAVRRAARACPAQAITVADI
ncbi:ferredoxin [Streptomyces sp. B1866]|uniref:ferredoxin n=1 Tax=Streptomyces sp. B1866 TaxID=3075431 RepID=UPI00289190AA|nr:ferredoxin [Streptomyces sp. B1866]MDT3397012.1 ferredoxin [Streptomyces sp. B1866]